MQLSSLPLDRIERALNEGSDVGIVKKLSGKQARVTDDDDDDEDDVDAALGKLDEQEERILLKLRTQRMKEMAAKAKLARFGRVYPISRVDYTREVTEASKENASSAGEEEDQSAGEGTGVVCFLYNDSMETCNLLAKYLDTLAAKYPSSKFVSIVGDKCIPNYPDKNLPTMLIYRKGELHRQIVGLRPEIGLDGMNTKCADIELLLTAVGAIKREEAVDAPGGAEEEQLDDEEKRSGGIRQGTGTGLGSAAPTTATKTQEDEDAELDWDL